MRVSFTKWQHHPHWTFDATRLGADEFGLWLGVPPGTRMTRPGRVVVTTYASVLLVSSGSPYLALFMARAASQDDRNPPQVYVDVTTAPVVEEDRVTAVDLDLDIVRLLDGTTFVKDEDEFALHQEQYGYPRHVIAAAEACAQQLETDVRSHEEPFGSASRRWMAEVVESCRRSEGTA